MAKPLVSVIIPAYNHQRFIGEAIESVLGQSCSDLELIIIDDGSTDNTAEVIKRYTDRRLSYYYQENQDAFNAINRGMGLAMGRYISILNSDDVYTLDRLEKILDQIGDSVCVITDVIPIADNGVEFTDPEFGWNLWHHKNRAFYRQADDIYTAFLKGNFMVTTSNLFMTAEAMHKTGKFCQLRYLHDYDYIFRLMLAFPGKVKYMYDDKLLYYRIHDGNTLGEAAITGRRQDQELITKYMLKKVPDDLHQYVIAGVERIAELERELGEVRQLLNPDLGAGGVRPAAKELAAALKRWLKKKLGPGNEL